MAWETCAGITMRHSRQERLWRTVKYEEVYLHDYRSVSEARSHLETYFQFYNMERIHEALGCRTPYEVYSGHHQTLTMCRLTQTCTLNKPIFCLDYGEMLIQRVGVTFYQKDTSVPELVMRASHA